MGKLPVIIAAASTLWAFSASAGEMNTQAASGPSITLAQVDVCIGPDCRRDRDYYRERHVYDYDRDRDWRYWRGEARCRDVTIRERRGDEVVIRHRLRCD
jgi:hypothetical protein